MAAARKSSRASGRPPLWVLSIVAAAVVLAVLVVNRPIRKPLVSARPLAPYASPVPAARRSAARQPKPATPAAVPSTSIAPSLPSETTTTPATVATVPPPTTVPTASLMGILPRTG